MKKLGFTLIELLIVISIIGILAALIMTNIQGVRERARDARRKSDLQAIKTSLRLYYNDNRTFPESTDGEIVDASWGGEFGQNGTIYINSLPLDPNSSDSTPVTYEYYQANDDSYALVAKLENGSDSDIAESQSRCRGPYNSSTNKDTEHDYVVCE